MKRLQLVMLDDVIYAETGELVPADGTHVLRLDELEAEVDLTAGLHEELRAFLLRFLRAGHPPGEEPLPPDAALPRRASPAAAAYNRAVREFADARGLRARSGRDRPAYKTETGKDYLPKWLRGEFDEYQRGIAAGNGNSAGSRDVTGAGVS